MIYQETKYFEMTPLNTTVRYNHDECSLGKSDALLVTRGLDHWLYKCHRCGESGIKSIRGIPPSDVLKLAKEIAEGGKGKRRRGKPENVILPLDITWELPAKAIAWLTSYELEHHANQWCYSPTLNRAILPIYKDDGPKDSLLGWTGRTMGIPDKITNPKWFHRMRKDFKHPHITIQKSPVYPMVVYVEDPLSALKVYDVMNHTVAVLGASIPKELLVKTIPFINVFWLDSDKQEYIVKQVMKYNSLGYRCRMIRTDGDPKDYTNKEIATKIEELL